MRVGSDIPHVVIGIHPRPGVRRQRNLQPGAWLDANKNGTCLYVCRARSFRAPGFELDVAADQAIAACGGDAREAVKALIVANGFLEAQVDELRAAVSTGYSRRR